MNGLIVFQVSEKLRDGQVPSWQSESWCNLSEGLENESSEMSARMGQRQPWRAAYFRAKRNQVQIQRARFV